MTNKTFYGPIVLESGFTGTNEFARAFFNACKTFNVDYDANNKTLVFSSIANNGSKIFFETDKIAVFEPHDNGYTKIVTTSGDTYNLWDAARKEVETELNEVTLLYLQEHPAPERATFEYKFKHTVNNRNYRIYIRRLISDMDIYINFLYYGDNLVSYHF